jgi:hypothetical protein
MGEQGGRWSARGARVVGVEGDPVHASSTSQPDGTDINRTMVLTYVFRIWISVSSRAGAEAGEAMVGSALACGELEVRAHPIASQAWLGCTLTDNLLLRLAISSRLLLDWRETARKRAN